MVNVGKCLVYMKKHTCIIRGDRVTCLPLTRKDKGKNSSEYS